MSALVYEVWDFETGNCIGAYGTEAEALDDVRDTVHRYGEREAMSLVLLHAPADAPARRVAAGAGLIGLAVDVADAPRYLGIGLYSIFEAAHIIGAKTSDLRRWLHRDSYKVRGKQYRRVPFVARSLPGQPDVVTFLELIELRVIKAFRDRGVRMRRIRTTARRLAAQWDTEFPFSAAKFKTDGIYIYTDLEGELEEGSSGQLPLDVVLGPFLSNIDYRMDGTAWRYWPRGRSGRVVLDAERQFGHPIDAETGVPTNVLYRAVKANPDDDWRTVAQWYGVPPAAVGSAFAYEDSLMAA